MMTTFMYFGVRVVCKAKFPILPKLTYLHIGELSILKNKNADNLLEDIVSDELAQTNQQKRPTHNLALARWYI